MTTPAAHPRPQRRRAACRRSPPASRAVPSSVIRDLLALTERPGVISFAGGLPAPGAVRRRGRPGLVRRGAGRGRTPRRCSTRRRRATGRCATPSPPATPSAGCPPTAPTSSSPPAPSRASTCWPRRWSTRATSCWWRAPATSPPCSASPWPGRGWSRCPRATTASTSTRSTRWPPGWAPKLLYTVPTFQNPTGRTLDLANRQAVVGGRRAARLPGAGGRPVRRAALLGRAGAPPRGAGRARPGGQHRQLLQDPGARAAAGLGAHRPERPGRASWWPSRRPTCTPPPSTRPPPRTTWPPAGWTPPSPHPRRSTGAAATRCSARPAGRAAAGQPLDHPGRRHVRLGDAARRLGHHRAAHPGPRARRRVRARRAVLPRGPAAVDAAALVHHLRPRRHRRGHPTAGGGARRLSLSQPRSGRHRQVERAQQPGGVGPVPGRREGVLQAPEQLVEPHGRRRPPRPSHPGRPDAGPVMSSQNATRARSADGRPGPGLVPVEDGDHRGRRRVDEHVRRGAGRRG